MTRGFGCAVRGSPARLICRDATARAISHVKKATREPLMTEIAGLEQTKSFLQDDVEIKTDVLPTVEAEDGEQVLKFFWLDAQQGEARTSDPATANRSRM